MNSLPAKIKPTLTLIRLAFAATGLERLALATAALARSYPNKKLMVHMNR